MPLLTRIVGTPVVTAAGTIHFEPGYNPISQAYYAPAPGFVVAPVPLAPTAREVAAARALVEEVFRDFPFVRDADRQGSDQKYGCKYGGPD